MLVSGCCGDHWISMLFLLQGFRPGFPPNCPPNFIPRGMSRPPYINPADFRLFFEHILLTVYVLWCCWLGGRKGIRPVKNWVLGCWRGYLSGARCRLAYAQLMPLPLTVSCFSKTRLVLPFWYRLTWVVPEKGPLNGCVCVCVCALVSVIVLFTVLSSCVTDCNF